MEPVDKLQWRDKSEQLVLAVQASLADTKIQDAIEREAVALKAEGITFVPRGGEELSEILRGHPDLVDDFFGRGWVEAFLGPEAAKHSAHDLTERNLLGRERRSAVSTMNEQTVADHWRRAMEAKEASKPKPKPAQRRTFAHIRDYRVAGR